MKKIVLVLLVMSMIVIGGCVRIGNKNLYLPEMKNDKTYTAIGGGDGIYQGEGYTLAIPDKTYRYEKEYDDGNMEETWEYIKRDDVEIKVTTFRNTDAVTARGRFLRDNDDYIFEDLTGETICGSEFDGDTLWFRMYESEGVTYILSWKYPKNTKEDLKKELADIAKTFTLVQ